MEITINDQMRELLLSCGMGFILGLYYECYRVPRLVMRISKTALFIQDIVYFLSAAVLTFLFSLAIMDGRLRFYLFLGEAIGFAVYYFTVGRLVGRIAVIVVNAVKFLCIKLSKIITAPFKLLIGLIYSGFFLLLDFLKKIVHKFIIFLKKCLKRIRLILYNRKKVSDNKTGTTPRAT
ncbi:MAG: spore cortex biosynthesis protein YabQ [Oscillospiraceae bacterium]|nr:spore cortex biosynthesis protein YabQ [Oscillospiraceae bacterium]